VDQLVAALSEDLKVLGGEFQEQVEKRANFQRLSV
jgi:hypothetical protein